jgi:hypothetical protein
MQGAEHIKFEHSVFWEQRVVVPFHTQARTCDVDRFCIYLNMRVRVH